MNTEINIDALLDTILDTVDDLLLSGSFNDVNNLLYLTRHEDSLELRLGWLTAAAPAKKILSNYAEYYQDTLDLCGKLGENPRTMIGLEP